MMPLTLFSKFYTAAFCMKRSPFWEAGCHSSNQGLRLSWNREINWLVHQNLPLDLNLESIESSP